MTESSIGRYSNLVANIRNWPAYFLSKGSGGFRPLKFQTRSGLWFEVPAFELYLVFKEIFMTDFYSVAEWTGQLPKNPVIVDVGANAGYFGMLLLSRRPDVTMFAYEPVQQNFDLYSKNISLNAGAADHIHVFPYAVTGTPIGEVVLFREADSNNSVTASVFSDFEKHNLQSVRVKAISLQEIIQQNNIRQIDLLKLDCEGSEYPILYDSPPEVWNVIKSLFLEVHQMDNEQRNVKALTEFLTNKGFHISSRLAGNGCYALHAVRS